MAPRVPAAAQCCKRSKAIGEFYSKKSSITSSSSTRIITDFTGDYDDDDYEENDNKHGGCSGDESSYHSCNDDDVAFRVFSIPSSAAASERNWSTYGFIHSALRNRLKDERASKLVYVFFNTKGLNQIEAKEEDFADCESDEDEY
eukprot:gene16473-22471_t